MTGRTRDYLADLANKKGVSLPNFQEAPQAEASRKIEELLKLPDTAFPELTGETEARVSRRIGNIIKGIRQWTFAE